MSSGGPLPRLLDPIARVIARAYAMGLSFDARRQLRGMKRVDVPVISVGNITVGGTGKTPFCGHLASALREAGGKPAIAMRGYRSSRNAGSDEAAEYRRALPWLPLLVGPDRATRINEALAQPNGRPGVVLLDDGFQHRRLHRDLDIVLVDARRPGIDGALLPAGWLREPPGSLARADLVVLTRSGSDDRKARELILQHRGSPPDASCRHAWGRIDVYHDGAHRDVLESSDLPGRRVAVCTGLGNPEAFVAQAVESGMTVTSHLRHPDHMDYRSRHLEALRRALVDADAVLTSAKDWVKLSVHPEIQRLGKPILVPLVRIEFLEGGDVIADRVRMACGIAPLL